MYVRKHCRQSAAGKPQAMTCCVLLQHPCTQLCKWAGRIFRKLSYTKYFSVFLSAYILHLSILKYSAECSERHILWSFTIRNLYETRNFAHRILNENGERNRRCERPNHRWEITLIPVLNNSVTTSVVKSSEFLAINPKVRIRFPALPDFLRSIGSGMGSTQPRQHKGGVTRRK
jgi:hypothetical protein